MRLFKYEGYKLTVEPEALLLQPFKVIWNRDKTPTKEKAMMELGFIYFFSDPRSDYNYISDPVVRENEIKLGEGLPKAWKPDSKVLEAIEFFNSFKSVATLLLEDTRLAINILRDKLRSIDLDAVDDKGKPVYSLNVITATIKQIPALVSELDKAEKQINSELRDLGRMRGQGEKTIMEDWA